jgi:peptide/nickel transport system substrate-binding protein
VRAGSTAAAGSSRRRFLGAGAASAALAGVSAACRKGASPAAKPGAAGGQQAATPQRGGTLNYAGGQAGSFDIQGRSFDPTIQTQYSSKSYTLFYQRLVAYNLATYAVEPELGQKWEQPSPTEYLFTIEPNVKWQNKPPLDGRPLTSADIVYSLNRARTDDPKVFSRSLLSAVDKIEAPDAGTVRITTKYPYASMLTALSVESLAILSHEVFEKNPKPGTADLAVGTGPFIMTQEEDMVGATYVRNPDYWKPGQPYLDGFRTRNFPDFSTAWSAVQAGQIDIALLAGADTKQFIAQQGAGYSPAWYPDDTYKFQYPNTRRKPMDDARVTQALRLLVDHDEFISAWAEPQFGKGGYGSIFPAALSAWDLTDQEYRAHLEWKQPKDDAAKAALSMLAAAGYTKDNPLKFTLDIDASSGNPAGGQLIQAQWKRLSQGVVDCDLKINQGSALDAVRAQRTFTYLYVGQSAGMVDPDIWLGAIYRSDSSQNFMGFNDPQVDAMIDKQRAIFDETQRKAVVKQLVVYMLDHCPAAMPANRFFLQAVRPRVKGFTPEYFLNGRQYQNVWLSQ